MSEPLAFAMDDDEPRPRLSAIRVAVAVVLIAGVAAGGAFLVRNRLQASAATTPGTWFAPYVDATLTPTYAFQDPIANPVQRVVLGFVVAQPAHPCAASWGGYYTPAQAERALNLDQRVLQVHAQGGVATISFRPGRRRKIVMGFGLGTALRHAEYPLSMWLRGS